MARVTLTTGGVCFLVERSVRIEEIKCGAGGEGDHDDDAGRQKPLPQLCGGVNSVFDDDNNLRVG